MITFGKKREKPVPTALLPAHARLASPAPPPAREEEPAWRVLPLDGLFEFSYLDASGRPSLRRLSASELKVGPGKLLLGGVDADLGAYRGFRVDRIRSLRAAGSGESVSRNILDWLLDRATRQAREKAAREKAERGGAARRRQADGGTGLAAA